MPPRFTPPEKIFDQEPHFDVLPAEAARRKRQRRRIVLAVLAIIILIVLAAGLWISSGVNTMTGVIYGTMTGIRHDADATQTGVVRQPSRGGS